MFGIRRMIREEVKEAMNSILVDTESLALKLAELTLENQSLKKHIVTLADMHQRAQDSNVELRDRIDVMKQQGFSAPIDPSKYPEGIDLPDGRRL